MPRMGKRVATSNEKNRPPAKITGKENANAAVQTK